MRVAKVHFRNDARALCGRAEVETTTNPHAVTCRDCRSYTDWARALDVNRWDNEADSLHGLALMVQR